MPNETTSTPAAVPKPPAPGREAVATVTEDSDDNLANQVEQQLGHASRSHVVTEEPSVVESAAIPHAAEKPAEEPKDGEDSAGEDADTAAKAASADAGEEEEPAGPGDEGADGSDDPAAETPPKSRRARKMARVQKDLADANARIAALEAEAREAPPAKTEPTPEPEADDFPSWEEYGKALGKWQYEQEKLAAAPAAPAADREVILPASWGDISDKYADFHATIRNETLHVTDTMTDQLIGMEAEGAEVLYYLGKHPDEAKRIASVSGEIPVARELAKLVTVASGDNKPTGNEERPGNGQAANVAPTVSNAPEPITGTEGGGAQGRVVDLNTADPEEFRRIRRQQIKARG